MRTPEEAEEVMDKDIEIDLRFAKVTRFQNRLRIESEGITVTLISDSPFVMTEGEEQLRLF